MNNNCIDNNSIDNDSIVHDGFGDGLPTELVEEQVDLGVL